jgi:hypothetical protein
MRLLQKQKSTHNKRFQVIEVETWPFVCATYTVPQPPPRITEKVVASFDWYWMAFFYKMYVSFDSESPYYTWKIQDTKN